MSPFDIAMRRFKRAVERPVFLKSYVVVPFHQKGPFKTKTYSCSEKRWLKKLSREKLMFEEILETVVIKRSDRGSDVE